MSRWANKYVIGLTGNIAVGKSVVRQMLQHLGAYTIDADGLSHQAMQPGAPAYQPVVNTFGQFILDGEKRINRQMLGNIVFSSPEALARLEAIVHPIVGQAINTLVSRATQPVVVIEAIKLLEGDLANAVDTVWVVDASPATQVKRLMDKRKMSEAEARQRVAAQGAQADKLKRASFVVNNDSDVENTWKQVQIGWGEMRSALAAPPAAPPKPATPPPPLPAVQARPLAQPPAPAAPPKPAAPPPTAARPAAPPPAPAAPPRPVMSPATDTGEIAIIPPPAPDTGIEVRRGMPGNAALIADFINKVSNKGLSRMDVMMAFGQKSYLIAEKGADNVVAVVGWQVENLITRVDEVYLTPLPEKKAIIQGLVNAIEEASKTLQSEVGFIFLPTSAEAETLQSFVQHGYEVTSIPDIKIPAWREAVQEIATENVRILRKQLRKDRVLKPI